MNEKTVWRKASASVTNGNCVEVSPWRKATASNPSGNCVQASSFEGGVLVRDSKDPDGPVLVFSKAEMAAFLDGARRGEFDDLVAEELAAL